MDVLDADLSSPNIPALESQLRRPRQRQLTEVPLLDARGDQRHGNVTLDAVDSHPGRYHVQYQGDQVYKLRRTKGQRGRCEGAGGTRAANASRMLGWEAGACVRVGACKHPVAFTFSGW